MPKGWGWRWGVYGDGCQLNFYQLSMIVPNAPLHRQATYVDFQALSPPNVFNSLLYLWKTLTTSTFHDSPFTSLKPPCVPILASFAQLKLDNFTHISQLTHSQYNQTCYMQITCGNVKDFYHLSFDLFSLIPYRPVSVPGLFTYELDSISNRLSTFLVLEKQVTELSSHKQDQSFMKYEKSFFLK